jgi:hypothetical protein
MTDSGTSRDLDYIKTYSETCSEKVDWKQLVLKLNNRLVEIKTKLISIIRNPSLQLIAVPAFSKDGIISYDNMFFQNTYWATLTRREMELGNDSVMVRSAASGKVSEFTEDEVVNYFMKRIQNGSLPLPSDKYINQNDILFFPSECSMKDLYLDN